MIAPGRLGGEGRVTTGPSPVPEQGNGGDGRERASRQPGERRIGRWVLRLGVVGGVALISAASVVLSLAATAVAFRATGERMDWTVTLIAALVPLVVAPLASAAVLRMMVDLDRARTRLDELARTDDLTGACNRRHFFEVAALECKRARRHRLPLSVLLLDADDFKRVNDVYGHATGDAALRAIGRACFASVRQGDVVARYGGEEFVVLLPHAPLEGARVVAERIRARVAAVPLEEAGQSIPLTVSIGMATAAEGQEEIEGLIKRADDAMYEAKRRGKNRVETAAPPTVA